MAVIVESKSMKDLAKKYESAFVSIMIDQIRNNMDDYINDQLDVSLDFDEVFDQMIPELLEQISDEVSIPHTDLEDFIDELRGLFHFESDPRFRSVENDLYHYSNDLKAYRQNPWTYNGLRQANFFI